MKVQIEVVLCEGCDEPISMERLRAVPSTKLCVPCVIAAGDPKIKRMDDSYGDEIYETYYFQNSYFELQHHRLNNLSRNIVGDYPSTTADTTT